MSAEAVRYEREGAVAWLTIDRPEARNAIDRAVGEGLWAGFRRFDADAGAAVLVLTGAGSAFCAGADLKEMAALRLAVPPPDMVPQLGRNLDLLVGKVAFNGVVTRQDKLVTALISVGFTGTGSRIDEATPVVLIDQRGTLLLQGSNAGGYGPSLDVGGPFSNAAGGLVRVVACDTAQSPGAATLTVETVEKLRPRLPGLSELADPARVTSKDLFGLLTVETLCDLVQTRLTDPRA